MKLLNHKCAYKGEIINLFNYTVFKILSDINKSNKELYFSCSAGKQLNNDKGMHDINNYSAESFFGVKFDMSKKEYILSHGSTSIHGMALNYVQILMKKFIDRVILIKKPISLLPIRYDV